MTGTGHRALGIQEQLVAGRYRLVRLVGVGGMAEVWEATDEVLSRPVAVKLLHGHLAADLAFVARFRREAVAAARLSHPHIVSIFDTSSDGGTEAIVMELVRGTTLRETLDSQGALPVGRAVEIAGQVADALECAHRSGIVHRDVKPGNVLLGHDGWVMVADFGIAKALHDDDGGDLTQTGALVGTAKYLAPEQVLGDAVDARTDVYATGVVLYEMLTGRPPFEGATPMATAAMRLHSDPLLCRQRRAGVPRELEAVVCRAMARNPADRHASAAALRSALLGLSTGHRRDADRTEVTRRAPAAPAPGRSDSPSFTQSERSWLVTTAVIVLVAATLAITGTIVGRTEVGRSLLDNARTAVGADPAEDAATAMPVLVAAGAFDPFGTGGENDDDAPNTLDGDATTVWRTETYDSRLDFQGMKAGVGLAFVVDPPGSRALLEVDSTGEGWAAEVYVADEAADELAGWGAPVASAEGIRGGASFDLGGAQGRAVLLWITDIGSGDPARVEISDVRLSR